MNKYCLLTNDVETTSIRFNTLSDKTGERVLKEGMPCLLEIYQTCGIQSTFFFTAKIAKKFPEVVRMILPYGHEVASHGLSHELEHAFDTMFLEQQCRHLQESKKLLQDISGEEVLSFRAPALRVNHHTPRALAQTGFKIDSSIASRRFDMFLSFGNLQKMNRLFAPRLPYYTDESNLARKGSGPIFEIPLSALLMPYVGTTMRIFPRLIGILRTILNLESRLNHKPINFLIHPNEFLDETEDNRKVQRRANNLISYLLADLVRNRLKLKNLGANAIPLYRREIEYFKRRNYQFVTLKDYYRLVEAKHHAENLDERSKVA